ncbi:Phospholipase/Carboxylesterase-domain-containing protein [Hygrophoropsis aurantiaca]|uniref:Phospholipase/Carboxylesterase-domain-containing protein n=1 Tax=Hygrophoropsis aurantiaca TaxID=72124 RepID=A0ACB8A7S2_9AGAM|nr:Phospholipase/Carboxylesterase-domain-containing protein [Hygrophoropsis aurantiaca]
MNLITIRILLTAFIFLVIAYIYNTRVDIDSSFSASSGSSIPGQSDIEINFQEHTSMAALTPLKYLTVSPLAKHTASIIVLHGLGDTGHGWKPVADMFSPELRHVKWILPHAPIKPVTINMGMEMTSWFDIYTFEFNPAEDEAEKDGLFQSMRSIDALIKAEVDAGIDPSRIVLAGFSQGGAVVGLTALLGSKARENWGGNGWNLGGVAVLSGWLALRDIVKELASPNVTNIPIFWGHGTHDPLIKYQYGLDSVAYLQKELSVSTVEKTGSLIGVDFRSYHGMGHSTCPKELNDLKDFFKRVLPANT